MFNVYAFGIKNCLDHSQPRRQTYYSELSEEYQIKIPKTVKLEAKTIEPVKQEPAKL